MFFISWKVLSLFKCEGDTSINGKRCWNLSVLKDWIDVLGTNIKGSGFLNRRSCLHGSGKTKVNRKTKPSLPADGKFLKRLRKAQSWVWRGNMISSAYWFPWGCLWQRFSLGWWGGKLKATNSEIQNSGVTASSWTEIQQIFPRPEATFTFEATL